MCAELADLGMTLARRAAAKALADWSEPEEPATPEAPLGPEIAEPAPRAPTPKPPRAAASSGRASSSKSTDPAIIFTRLVTSVRDCIILEARLATGPATPSRAAALTLRADPRRASLQKVFRRVTEHHPDHADLVRETNARIDEDLGADPDRTLDLRTIFFTICEDLGIEPDLAILPDEYIGLFPDTPAPDPRATSPPRSRNGLS